MTVNISGFTFLRNAVQMDYPFIESIKSILPVVDEFIINVGPCDDETLEVVQSINDRKIKIIRSQWNPNVLTGGYIYAQQTNIALFNCTGKWAFYLQADEVVHEEDLPLLVELMRKHENNDNIEGIALNELTFWGDYNTIINVFPWRYSRRCWIVKPHKFVLSRGDAADFTVHPKYKERGRRLRAIDSGAKIFHYSFVKTMAKLSLKYKQVFKYWGDKFTPEMAEEITQSFYNSWFPRQFVGEYTGSHPAVMQERISRHNVKLDLNSPLWRTKLTWQDRKRLFQTWLIKCFGDRFVRRQCCKIVKS